uniref:Uncharacterized protein n=1 Tax=viral metagenome TaxID=1070528 RepID=A0A6C0JM66_9ZZZZ
MVCSLPSRALPSRALPSRALPSRALQIISDYSKPVTRPDWRQSKPIITTYKLYLFILTHDIDYVDLSSPDMYRRILWQISDTDWYHAYTYIRFYGFSEYIKQMEGEENYMLDASVDGIQEAEQIHKITTRY